MYLHYCETQKPDTQRIPCQLSEIDKIRQEKAFHITPLAVSELAPESWDNVRYKGDWWFDVDEPNLTTAITSLHRLMDALEKLDVNLEHLRYFASGSKGFHIRVPASVFDGDKEQKNLPKIYKQMALRLVFDYRVTGIDTNLYNGKTGHLLRVENKPRPDGKFKVPITLAEARAITVEQYGELTRQPREIAVPSVPADVRAEGLAKMYAECRNTAESLPDNTKRAGSSADLAVLNGKIPRCVLWLSQSKNTECGWNSKAMQLTAFRQAAGLDDELLEAAARNHKGDSQRTPSDLLSALEAKQGSRIQWSCAATNALFSMSPCPGCPVNQTLKPAENGQTKTMITLIQASGVIPKSIEWLWDSWLAAGKLHVLGGAPGTGKTSLCMALAATVSGGGRWPDGSRCTPGNVLVWSGEDDPEDTLIPRLILSGADLTRVFFISGVDDGESSRPFDPSTDVVLLERQARAIGGVRLMIIDPLVSAVSGDSHKNAEVRRGLQPLVDLAGALRCALIGITHLTKGTGGRDPVERLTGSLAFGALARVVFLSFKKGEGRVFAKAKSNISSDVGAFQYDLHQGELASHPGVFTSAVRWGLPLEGNARELMAEAESLDNKDGKSSKQAEAQGWLVDFLKSKGCPTTATEICNQAQDLGFNARMIRRAKKALESDGALIAQKVGHGSGQQWLWVLSRPKTANAV